MCFAPGHFGYDLSFKNQQAAATLPNEIAEDVADIRHTLPVIYIYSYDINKLLPGRDWWYEGGPSIPPREESAADIYVFDSGDNFLTDTPGHVYYNATIRLRGRTSSVFQEKKSFKVEFKTEDGAETNYPFMGLGPDSDFVLYAPYADRSIIRNWLAYTLEKQALDWVPDCLFAEVYLDTPDDITDKRDYIGVYLVAENIKRGPARVNMPEYTPGNFYTGSNYIYKLDFPDEDFETGIVLPPTEYGNSYVITYPKAAQRPGAEGDMYESMQELDRIIYTGSDSELAMYFDLEQIAGCMLIDEYMKCQDAISGSTFFYRRAGDKVKMIQWDFDLGTGNMDYDPGLSNAKEFFVLNHDYVKAFLSHPVFRDEMLAQWDILRGSVLSDKNVTRLLQQAEDMLEGAWQRNDEAWPGAFTMEHYFTEDYDIDTSVRDRRYIKDFLLERGKWLDENLPDFLENYSD